MAVINALTDMIIEAMSMKEKSFELRKTLKPSIFVTEHCTVRFGLPRRCGNTNAVKYAAQEFKKAGYKCIVLYPDGKQNQIHKGNGTVVDFIKQPRMCDVLIIDGYDHVILYNIIKLYNTYERLSSRKNFILALVA